MNDNAEEEMTGMQIGGIAAIAWGVATLGIALAKPKALWDMAKIAALRRSFGDTGTVVFMGVWAVVAIGGGVALLTM